MTGISRVCSSCFQLCLSHVTHVFCWSRFYRFLSFGSLVFGFGLVLSGYTRRVALKIFQDVFTDFRLGIGEAELRPPPPAVRPHSWGLGPNPNPNYPYPTCPQLDTHPHELNSSLGEFWRLCWAWPRSACGLFVASYEADAQLWPGSCMSACFCLFVSVVCFWNASLLALR